MAKKKNDRADQDSPWKRILRLYFREAIEFLFSHISDQIDWTRPVEFLDKDFIDSLGSSSRTRNYLSGTDVYLCNSDFRLFPSSSD